jgi:phospholipid-binding lipoprotein MlaA
LRSRSDAWTARALSSFALALALGGCGSLSGGLQSDSLLLASPTVARSGAGDGASAPEAETPAPAPADPAGDEAPGEPTLAVTDPPAPPMAADAAGETELLVEAPTGTADTPFTLSLDGPPLLAQSGEPRSSGPPPDEEDEEEYDPLEKFNESMFEVNRKIDRFVIKPLAKAYNFVMPDLFQQMVSRGFDNLGFPHRFLNNLLQGKWGGAGRELLRFLINSTVGMAGTFDVARDHLDLEPSKEDFGQTLGTWGVGPGAYLVLPLLPPLTIRDGIGYGVDIASDPLAYVLPFVWPRLSMRVGNIINERALNLDVFEGIEETTVDLYSAVKNAYLSRRRLLIKQ